MTRIFALAQAMPGHIGSLRWNGWTAFEVIPWIFRESDMQLTTAPNEQARSVDFELLDRYWRAANYLSVGQIYLLANPLLKEPLKPEHIKPRLLGHWGTTPGLNFIYAHLNRVIRGSDLNVIYVCGPGHGGPGMVANTYLEGTYTEIYPEVTRDTDGLRKLFRQFSFPGAFRATPHRKRPVQFMKVANSATHWSMPMVRHSTILT